MPILKQLVASSNQSKRRSRIDLTADMISAPLGDFRHTMHVGRGGDVFGDTSFLSSKVGAAAAAPPPAEATPKPGLLSRKFRSSSKRSQSVTRVDKRDTLTQSDSAIFVKNAVSLPQLNDKTVEPTNQMAKSLSSSPLKKLGSEQMEDKPVNGAVSITESKSTEYQDERDFGDITDLPTSLSSGGFPLKHAESIMSFHVDLGPSMLGDILSVMEKDTWENDIDLGFGDDKEVPHSNSQKVVTEKFVEGPAVSTVALQSNINNVVYSTASGSHLSQDSGSVSSLASGATEERRSVYEGVSHGDVDSMKNIAESRDAFREEENEGDEDFTFMDEEDEIRV
ncbi:cdc42 effector protein 4 [Cetorhinus maximus]|uniref:cdc42 effector protein 4-like n=1 Tax=Carcharodon carcharias TaxID=13397 RepID=UPI001B7E71A2|nr:cdc42 effector protein 4-like [Carcharodon carcharias]XP_041072659.1 cdc42 effector protein 4-like [Carcharodon carcharias]XP_041072660.1 cdc42 effector protein 4-like [Carcharodon carcharias]XP_041072661.1 cdc42 effector protein 4-like [Carcharodon carcharias]XP_041072662.1 cdc42 effector protein 4-like [Carcharodon carcharias]XP_041072663.1 cdc42 effector protein 4-like [Carcharodon carcharias]